MVYFGEHLSEFLKAENNTELSVWVWIVAVCRSCDLQGQVSMSLILRAALDSLSVRILQLQHQLSADLWEMRLGVMEEIVAEQVISKWDSDCLRW